MRSSRIIALATCFGAIGLIGCSESSSTDTAQTTPPVEAPVTSPADENGIPSTLFVSAAPANATSLIDAKNGAKPGSTVVFEARIGGRRAPFVDNRAIFSVADSSLLSCDQLHGDSCKLPWDYCCEPKENLLKHMATIQIVDANGKPFKLSLNESHGLAPLKTVFVSGTVDQIDESGNFVVNASQIYVQEG